MRIMTIVSVLALGVLSAPTFARDAGPAAGAERQWLSIPQVHARLEAAGYRNIEKIEREHGSYEVKATDRNGERIRLHVNPQTGEIVDQRQDGRRRDAYAGSGAPNGQRPAAECSKRRCRDDLPQSGTAAPAPAAK
jgi:hypothetical protein